jgi:carboxymethylenebutenolidase
MHERMAQVPTGSGTMETFVAYPGAERRFPAVILYMDIWGLREELFGIGRRIAEAGYCALVPDLYYRQGRVRHEFRDANNRMITLTKLDPARQEQVLAPLRKLPDAMVMEDTGALLSFAEAELPVGGAPVGAIGYCMGGRFALLAFGQLPGRVHAAASLHGTNLVTDAPDSPHRVAARGRGEVYCGFGERDPHGGPPIVAALRDALAGTDIRYTGEVHAAAEHGYALPDRDIHDARATERDWTAIFAAFRRQLQSAVATF